MTDFIVKALQDKTLGLSLHFPFIHASVTGLEAQKTLEFGGQATRVFIEALSPHNGKHWSISDVKKDAVDNGPFDIILHNGSSDTNTMTKDIEWAFKRLRTFGLLLVHNIHHLDLGEKV